MTKAHDVQLQYVRNIARSGITIYDPIAAGDPQLWIPAPALEKILSAALRGFDLRGLPLRTRSKVVKTHVCKALGYPAPPSFKKTQPRFPGQLFDTYIQKGNNLQIWNEKIEPERRYVILRVSEDDVIERVKVITGEALAEFDTTGTLTQKYQARLVCGDRPSELITRDDTPLLRQFTNAEAELRARLPTQNPAAGSILPIAVVFQRLIPMLRASFLDSGHDQERRRGADLHRLVCERLGYEQYADDGQFPDIRDQLIEVKLQTSPTIDLGLVRPDSAEPLDVPQIEGHQIRHLDVRYAVFSARTDGRRVTITHVFLTTGDAFFSRFR